MRRYDRYKTTDQVWIPHIPEHWNMMGIKYEFDEISDKNHVDEVMLVASQHMGVVPKSFYGSRTVEATKRLELFKRVKVGDFVISLRSFQGGLEYAYYQGIISPTYTILRCNNPENNQYFRLLFKSAVFIKLLTLCVTGIREGQNIDYSTLKSFSIPVPPRPEQDQIVHYLDYKTTKIDKLISGYKRQIELLEERKRSFAFNAATKGLLPTYKKRTSDIYWLDSVPNNWETKTIVQLFDEVKCKNIGMQENNLLSLSYGTIKQRDINATEGLLPESFEGYNIIQENDIVLRLTDLQNDHKSLRTGISKEKGIITSAYLTIRNKSNNNVEYMHLFLHSFDLAKGFYNIGASGVRQSLNWDTIKTLKILIPPIEEQKNIISAVKAEYKIIEESKKSIQKQIALLQEYRIRLISDVVTGQIDVRNEIIPDTEVNNIDN